MNNWAIYNQQPLSISLSPLTYILLVSSVQFNTFIHFMTASVHSYLEQFSPKFNFQTQFFELDNTVMPPN